MWLLLRNKESRDLDLKAKNEILSPSLDLVWSLNISVGSAPNWLSSLGNSPQLPHPQYQVILENISHLKSLSYKDFPPHMEENSYVQLFCGSIGYDPGPSQGCQVTSYQTAPSCLLVDTLGSLPITSQAVQGYLCHGAS